MPKEKKKPKEEKSKKKVNSRQKGARFERTVAHMLREHGYEAERGVQHQGGKDSPDVKCNLLNTHIEAKFVESLNIWKALEQSERDAGENEIPIVIFKRSRSKVYVALPFEDYITLQKAYEKEITNEKDNRTEDNHLTV